MYDVRTFSRALKPLTTNNGPIGVVWLAPTGQEGGPVEWQRESQTQDRSLGFFSMFWHNYLESELLRSFLWVIIFKRQWFLTRLSIRGRMFLPWRPNAPRDEDCNDSTQRPDERDSDSVRVLEAQKQKSDEKRNHTILGEKMWDGQAITKQIRSLTSTSVTHMASWTWWLGFLIQAEDELCFSRNLPN